LTTPCVWLLRLVARLVASLVVDYFAYATRPGASARHAAHRRLLHLRRASGCLGTSRGSSRGSSSTTSPPPHVREPRHVARLVAQACRRLLHLRRASGCFDTSRDLSRDSLSTTSPHAGSSSTTSPTPRVRVPRHVARLVAWLVTPLVIDYFASAARPGASARRAAWRAVSLLSTSPTPHVLLHRHVAQLIT
jgi:hypothetical protein